jgi:ATP-dependent helicase/nuclease subunit B
LQLRGRERAARRYEVQIRMLLGPAGSGKTFRCLNEIRNELAARPEGRPLIFLAPKQATFQLERQLLGGDDLAGYARLRIFSFQRLARFIFESCESPPPRLLSAEGRVMVLRALLGELHGQFTIFKSSARRLGFASEASEQIREFQQHGLSPRKLREIAAAGSSIPAREKLLDLALLLEAYNKWLSANGLRDEEWLLPLAAELLERNPGTLNLAGVWFDGFAQLTPEERRLLGASLGETEKATLAFCLDRPAGNSFSPWFLVSQTFERCRAELETRFGKEALQVEWLERSESTGRFKNSPALAHLERAWASGQIFEGAPESLRVFECADAEMEVIASAREILRFIRGGGRYREAAVLLRGFTNDYPHLFRRIFARYGIPFFLDHREGVAHHPLAELTRGAVRMVLFNWRQHDCFGVFKSGLLPIAPEFLDDLENEALEHGWEGAAWRDGFRLPKDSGRERELNFRRAKLAEPFFKFAARLEEQPSGLEMTAAIRELWAELNVEAQLGDWSRGASEAIHQTVWEQMTAWLENVELAFARQRLPLRDWLSIIEAGLNGLTVGVIPPVLDQVLIGTVDRSRNPDLKLIFVLGLNEGFFPAIPPHKPLLTEQDRGALLDVGCELANVPSLQISQEQFYGYIACTRAREKVILSYARASESGTALNPSRFIGQARRLFPKLAVEFPRKPRALNEVEHECELGAFSGMPALRNRTRSLPDPDQDETLDPALALRLYGKELKVSVSAMERYASCPFRFFVEQALRVRERAEFTLDIREQGSFQHMVLARFHQEVRESARHWRDLSVPEAREWIARIADDEMIVFRDGLLLANEQNRFTGENYKATLQDFIGTVVEWFGTNAFDPIEVELPFGQGEGLPGWRVPLENGRELVLGGRIDRVDVHRREDGRAACIVIDYKSGAQRADALLLHYGIQQQLPAYLLALTRLPEVKERFGVSELEAAGCFYVPLGAKYDNEKTRAEVLANLREARKTAYKHFGIFDFAHLEKLDAGFKQGNSGQFQYGLTKDLQPSGRGFAALFPDDFNAVLRRMEENARNFATRIYEGNIAIRPFKKGNQTACDRCPQQSVCRFDPWTREYNILRSPAEAKGGE